jgi:hypothetical protein
MLDEFGKPTPYEKVLVGTLPDGTVAEKNCMDWTSTDPAGNVAAGYSNAGNERWTSWLTYFCNRETPIYCLGTDVQLGLPAPGATGRAAFASAGQFKPDGGLAGADGLCQGEAAWASLTGTFKALLATSAASAMSRFSEGADWVRPDGIPVWESAADARGGATPLAPILVQADGTRSASEFAWAGAPSTTDVAQFSCEDWSSALLTKNGSTATLYYVAEDWFGAGFSENCNRSADKDIRVICLQD